MCTVCKTVGNGVDFVIDAAFPSRDTKMAEQKSKKKIGIEVKIENQGQARISPGIIC